MGVAVLRSSTIAKYSPGATLLMVAFASLVPKLLVPHARSVVPLQTPPRMATAVAVSDAKVSTVRLTSAWFTRMR